MQKIQYDKYGGPELMRLEEVEPPASGAGPGAGGGRQPDGL